VEPPAVEPPAVEPPAVEPPSEEAIDETASVEPEAPTVEAEPDHSEEFEEEVSLLSEAELKKIKSKDRVVGILLKKGIVTTRDIKRAQRRQEDEQLKEPLWRVLTLVSATRNEIFAQAANVYAFKAAVLGDGKPDPDFARSVMDTFDEQLRDSLLKLRVVPFEVDLDPQTGAIKVVFITHDPTRPEVHRMMQKLKLERFELRYAPEKDVKGLILEAFPRKNEFLERLDEEGGMAFDLGASYDEQSDLIDEDALEAEISRSKLINLFEATLVEAVRQEASDVHIWPNARKQVEIHFRIDGRLQRWHVEDKIHPEALIAVIKDNSINVDRFERDAAQDGFIQRWIDEALIRFRVSVLPIANAAQDVRSESIVIRVLDDRKVIKDLRQLGLDEVAFQRFRKAISQPHGMVILTGPTGSGKTTTLYASLHEVVSPEVNVLTVEDPVEYILPGVRQIKLNNKLGLEGALRSILRHDPDVVMVGEMRDRPTAELAIKLANTGHLTFSTLHTNDAASAVSRLYKMGIEPFLIAYAINLVVAQRLIRRLCRQCKKVDLDPDHVLLKNLGFSQEEIAETTFYTTGHDENCPVCKGLGFKGRRAVSEAMYFSREIRHMIADSDGKLDEQEIKALGVKQGMMTLQDSAREVVKTGDTSVLEMLRVVSSDD
ncbi:MAG: GspE/PulE family protein, partial [Rhodothermales bacterium]